jgi:hypothetical protein
MECSVGVRRVRSREFGRYPDATIQAWLRLVQQRSILNQQVGKKFRRDVARQPHNPHSAPAEHFDQRVAAKYDLAAGSVERSLEKATGAATFRRVARDFGSALLANSDYRRHFGSR